MQYWNLGGKDNELCLIVMELRMRVKDWCGFLTAGEMVEPASEVDHVADVLNEEEYLVGRPANDESTAHHQRSDRSVASCRGCDRTGSSRVHLNTHHLNSVNYYSVFIHVYGPVI